MAPLLIGLLIAVIGSAMGPLTGFAMNPARDFGPKLMTYLAGWGPIAFTGGREIPISWCRSSPRSSVPASAPAAIVY
ncbi:aquaporin [Pseudomonas aeruginosa]|nr:aquaporin [Pseudomonas aeruginosa]